MIELTSIAKTLGRKLILSNVSLSLRPGEIVGIAGSVGAGKSTLLHIMTGLMSPDSGSVSIMGLPLLKRRQLILQHLNYASSSQRLSGYATVMENLTTYGLLYDTVNAKRHIASFWKYFGMQESLFYKKVYRLSSGENSLVNLAKSLINNPKILLLDEITAHMDPILTRKTHDFLRNRNTQSKLTVLVSQNPEEIRSFCTRMIIMSKGSLVYDGKPLLPSQARQYYV